MMIQVRSLNAAGLAQFAAWLDDPVGEPPRTLLEDDSASDVVRGAYQIDPSRTFATSYALGQYLVDDVFTGTVERVTLLADEGMWAWISLAFVASLVKKGAGAGAGKPLSKSHYLTHAPRVAYRLIARTAWDLVKLHGESAEVALGSTKSPWGEMAEQMTSRQEIYAHGSFWPVARLLYSMPDGSLKKGATSQRSKKARQDPDSKSGLGGVRRLPFTFRQFERTYNLRQMTGEQIEELLPTEYKRWRDF